MQIAKEGLVNITTCAPAAGPLFSESNPHSVKEIEYLACMDITYN